MKHVWTILCKKSHINEKNNLLDILNCVEQLIFTIDRSKAPKDTGLIIPVELQLISFWIVENQKKENILDFREEMLDPDGKLLSFFDEKINVDKNILRLRNIVNIQTIKITKEGRYVIKVKQRESEGEKFKTVAEIPLDIKIIYKKLNDSSHKQG